MGFAFSWFYSFRRLRCSAVDAPSRKTYSNIYAPVRNYSPSLLLLSNHFTAAAPKPQTRKIARRLSTGDILALCRRITCYIATVASSISRTATITDAAAPPAAAGTKRKRMSEPKFYAVQAGHRPGVYTSWTDCLNQIRGFKGAKCILPSFRFLRVGYLRFWVGPADGVIYHCFNWAAPPSPKPHSLVTRAACMLTVSKVKSFSTSEDAQMFMTGKDPSLDPASSSYTAKFYGVRSGRVPGVYTDWASAEAQVKGVTKPKVKYGITIRFCAWRTERLTSVVLVDGSLPARRRRHL
jgi:hypothetical protein